MDNSGSPPDLTQYPWADAFRILQLYFSHHGQGHQAEDLAQITMSRVWIRLLGHPVIEGENGFHKLLYGFAHFVLLEARRDLAKVLRDMQNTPPGLLRPPPLPGPSSALEDSQLWQRALDQLSEREQFIVIESESRRRSEKAIADDLGLTVKAYRVALSRARTKLRRFLEKL
jgi:RNA polymerase sigma factor (sigma-70 family)